MIDYAEEEEEELSLDALLLLLDDCELEESELEDCELDDSELLLDWLLLELLDEMSSMCRMRKSDRSSEHALPGNVSSLVVNRRSIGSPTSPVSRVSTSLASHIKPLGRS